MVSKTSKEKEFLNIKEAEVVDNNYQIPLDLIPSNPYSPNYFVPHSGVQAASTIFNDNLNLLINNKQHNFKLFYIFGPKGSGKRHFANVLEQDAINSDINTKLFLETSDKNTWIRNFISNYEDLKAKGGIIIVVGRDEPEKAFLNPHSGSRLKTATLLELSYPQDIELEPIIKSIAEKHNIKLSKYISSYLLRRLPARPLSFSDIFARINELSLVKGKPVNQPVVRLALGESSVKTSSK